jgi:hypothetical protein
MVQAWSQLEAQQEFQDRIAQEMETGSHTDFTWTMYQHVSRRCKQFARGG